MRQEKGLRKKRSLYNRKMLFNHILGVFQKAYTEKRGEPKERFEDACNKVDEAFKTLANSEPNKQQFFMLVFDDFKKFLIQMSENEDRIRRVCEAAEAKKKEPELVGV